ncbi:MAG: pyrroline-5-carboxylate reductase [Akkermansiaceae bacterium]|nr:pyrroline-5-carboxylate reductase [Akkermansiaceae bacterium]
MKLGMVGCGRMGKSLAIGAIEAGAVEAKNFLAHDVRPEAVEELTAESGIQAATNLNQLVTSCDVLLLCTKPDDAHEVLREVASSGTDENSLLIISIAAGLTVRTIEQYVLNHARVIRAMPNTPALVGKGAAAYTLGTAATPADGEIAEKLLGSVGSVVQVKEKLMDVVTGLSGSGPGYVYLFIEALADGGVRNGLPREQALQLATQTVLGAASMVQASGLHPAVLKDMVTSPGGTTIAGLSTLESEGFRSACIQAVTAATERSKELGKG